MATNILKILNPLESTMNQASSSRKREPLNELPETKNVLLAYPRDTKS